MSKGLKGEINSPLLRTWLGRIGVWVGLGFCPLSAQVLDLPARSSNAPPASLILQQIASLDLSEREKVLESEILSGNVPNFLRKMRPVEVTNSTVSSTNVARFWVTPDYLAVGSDQDYFLAPLSPYTAQRIASTLRCSLPTRKMVDAIYRAAPVKLTPEPISPSAAMTTVAVFSNHNALVRTQRSQSLSQQPLGALVAGHKKDVVLTPKLSETKDKVAIYGWHQTNGRPIQPLYLGHTANWVDYSQCIRLVQQRVLVNGESKLAQEILANPQTAGLLSDEGPITNSGYARQRAIEPRPFRERILTLVTNAGVHVTLNSPAPDEFVAGKKVLLIYYAVPNGNTAAQTAGRNPKPGDDWHYDIQHIAAQTRFLRQVLTNRVVVVGYLENELLSWPAWRKQYGDTNIPALLNTAKALLGDTDCETVLASHSGGGSLIFGYLNAVERIPDEVVRIAFLDSNYAYDPARGHARKLAGWLKGSEKRLLCVLAYNDAIALLNGKSFVSAAGGTWGRSHLMQQNLSEFFPFERQEDGDFERFSALSGRVQFLLKENPERQVLHTLQVEFNGFIHALLVGTPHENKGYQYYGPRAYSIWIQD